VHRNDTEGWKGVPIQSDLSCRQQSGIRNSFIASLSASSFSDPEQINGKYLASREMGSPAQFI
jgi:hypothetical protein